ncbi:MAG: hypothetical protein R3351_07035, partial [Nitrospirales bacterium]|nr:hypothetical protein [Nitrospirales bacterium]
MVQLLGCTTIDPSWDSLSSRVLYKQSLLSNIEIRHDEDGTGGTYETVVRKYVFDYDLDGAIFPSVTWPTNDGMTPALVEIEEFGLGGTSSLPPTTFSYDGDNMHLEIGDNGYGGEVEFSYDTSPWHEIGADSKETVSCNPNPNSTFSGDVYLDDVQSQYCSNLATFKEYFQPGGYYLISTQAKRGSS